MVMAWSIKARTMSINVQCAVAGVVPDDDDDEDVIRTTGA
jgi:hypothetical protein